MRRFVIFTNRHPILSILIGYAALVLLTLLVVPADAPSVDAAIKHRSNT